MSLPPRVASVSFDSSYESWSFSIAARHTGLWVDQWFFWQVDPQYATLLHAPQTFRGLSVEPVVLQNEQWREVMLSFERELLGGSGLARVFGGSGLIGGGLAGLCERAVGCSRWEDFGFLGRS